MRLLLLLCFAACLSACGPSTRCEDTLVSRIPSPNGRYEAVYSIHDCGATTRRAVWIRVVPLGASPDSVEPVATFEGELTTMPAWKGRTLHIHYGRAKPFRMETSFEDARIEYAAD
jgi:hypothetical protein